MIGAATGIISTASGANLDPDLSEPKQTSYRLTVIALDGGVGESRKTATTTVEINVTNVNNKPPILNDPGTITVRENSPVSITIKSQYPWGGEKMVKKWNLPISLKIP